MDSLSKFNEFASTTIIFIVVIGTLFVAFKYLSPVASNNSPEINNFQVLTNDSTYKTISSADFEKIVGEQVSSIYNKQNLLDRFFTTAIAIILAIAGFFGFKSIREIKNETKKEASNQASKIAKETIKERIDIALKNEISQYRKDFTTNILNILEPQIQEIRNDIFLIQKGTPDQETEVASQESKTRSEKDIFDTDEN